MPTNLFASYEDIRNDISSLGVAAIASAPVIGAAAFAFNKMQANTPIQVQNLTGSQNRLSSLGREIGKSNGESTTEFRFR
jgi:hypothetical protein